MVYLNFRINLIKLKELNKCKDAIKLLMSQINFIRDLIGKTIKFESLIWT
jgi:hypothetical protein